MSRIGLAFSCFFRLLFRGKLPAEARAYLPAGAVAELGVGGSSGAGKADVSVKASASVDAAAANEARAAAKAAEIEAAAARVVKEAERAEKAEKAAERARANVAAHHRDGALAMLALLQRDGRLVDFLREPLDGFGDADIGAAARDVHRGCKKVLDQYLTLEPVMPGAEESTVTVPKGFEPTEIRLIGEARGEGPYRGTMRHHGWRATEARLPALAEGVDRAVLAPAEVEVGA